MKKNKYSILKDFEKKISEESDDLFSDSEENELLNERDLGDFK